MASMYTSASSARHFAGKPSIFWTYDKEMDEPKRCVCVEKSLQEKIVTQDCVWFRTGRIWTWLFFVSFFAATFISRNPASPGRARRRDTQTTEPTSISFGVMFLRLNEKDPEFWRNVLSETLIGHLGGCAGTREADQCSHLDHQQTRELRGELAAQLVAHQQVDAVLEYVKTPRASIWFTGRRTCAKSKASPSVLKIDTTELGTVEMDQSLFWNWPFISALTTDTTSPLFLSAFSSIKLSIWKENPLRHTKGKLDETKHFIFSFWSRIHFQGSIDIISQGAKCNSDLNEEKRVLNHLLKGNVLEKCSQFRHLLLAVQR